MLMAENPSEVGRKRLDIIENTRTGSSWQKKI